MRNLYDQIEIAIAADRVRKGQPGGIKDLHQFVIAVIRDGWEIDEIGRDNLVTLLTQLEPTQKLEQKKKVEILRQLKGGMQFNDETQSPPKVPTFRSTVAGWHQQLQEKNPQQLSHVENRCREMDLQTCYEFVSKWNRAGRLK